MHDGAPRLRAGRQRPAPLTVPDELFRYYQRALGPVPTLLWLNLRWLLLAGSPSDPWTQLERLTGLAREQLHQAAQVLVRFDLLTVEEDGTLLLHEPLTSEALPAELVATPARGAQPAEAGVATPPGLAPLQPAEEAATAGAEAAPAEGAEEEGEAATARLEAELRGVVNAWESLIGLLGPRQEERLRFWLEARGMSGPVVMLAIREAAQSPEKRRIEYVDGILRNWHNAGARTLEDVRRLGLSAALRPAEGEEGEAAGTQRGPRSVPASGRSLEGAANADAYRLVDPEWVQRWKEMFPDEYGR